MIQRIQSIYLLLGVLMLGAFVALNSMWSVVVSMLHEALPVVVYALAAAGGLVGFASVLIYKSRKNQMKLVTVVQWIALLLLVVVIVAFGILGFRSGADSGPIQVSAYLVLLLPIGAYILFSLARRAVKKDIELVRSMDRLR